VRWRAAAAAEPMGLKALTVDNFLLPDPVTGGFVGRDGDGREHRLSAVDWAHEVLGIALGERVPWEVARQFELAQGVLVYGFFWSELWSHGATEALRAGEVALSAACARLGAPKRATGVAAQIDWLSKRGFLDEAGIERWESFRQLRDVLMFPSASPPLTPPQALEVLEAVAFAVVRLFEGEPVEEQRRR